MAVHRKFGSGAQPYWRVEDNGVIEPLEGDGVEEAVTC
jgi:hypothetical protein